MILIDIRKEYHRIISLEAANSKNSWSPPSAVEMEGTSQQIAQIALSSTVQRSYALIYGLTNQKVAFESDGAHTNLMAAIVDRALSYLYGPSSPDYEGYSYREIMEAVRRHDLAENLTGDQPDNGTQNKIEKTQVEQKFWHEFSCASPQRETDFEVRVNRLLLEMQEKSSFMGRLLYSADKICAVIITLCYDSCGLPPIRHASDPSLSNRDRAEMAICEERVGEDGFYASEMWAADYFKIRPLVDYDETGFFTALLVMYTLQVKGHWYRWRQSDYLKTYP